MKPILGVTHKRSRWTFWR